MRMFEGIPPTISGPLLPEIGVCALVPDRWDAPWQTCHYVLRSLARYFHIVWVNPADEWRGMFGPSVNHDQHKGDTLYPPGLMVYAPELWLPKLYRAKRLAQYVFHI